MVSKKVSVLLKRCQCFALEQTTAGLVIIFAVVMNNSYEGETCQT